MYYKQWALNPGEVEMEEEKFFITERVINDSEFKGIHGILKHRYFMENKDNVFNLIYL